MAVQVPDPGIPLAWTPARTDEPYEPPFTDGDPYAVPWPCPLPTALPGGDPVPWDWPCSAPYTDFSDPGDFEL